MKLKRTHCFWILSAFMIFSIPVLPQGAGPDLSTPADNTLNYKLTKVTYVWTSVQDATYELQICKADSFKLADGLKTYLNLDTTFYSPSDFLEFNTRYYWRVRAKVNSVYTDYSSVFDFTTGTPASIIETADVKLLFKHNEGRITEITFKQGSNKQLLDSTLNTRNKTGLARISGETGTKVVSWTENPGNYTYNYENNTYGSKTVNIKWNADSIIVTTTLNLAASKSAVLASSWKPGGDIGPLHDNVLYSNPSDAANKRTLIYPTSSNNIYNGNTNLVVVSDDRFDELFGFRVSDSVATSIYQDVAFNSSFSYPASGSPQTKVLTFAVTGRSDFYAWASKKYLFCTYPQEMKLPDQSSVTVKWESFGVSGNVNIHLSVDGGSTYPYALANNTANDGTQAVTLPNLSASVPLNNCIIRITGTGATAYSKVFSIVADAGIVFRIPTDLTCAPSEVITIPVIIDPGSDTVHAFDVRLYYEKDVLGYLAYTPSSLLSLGGWNHDVTNNASAGYLQIGAFNDDPALTTQDTVVNLIFSIKNAARVGIQTSLRINNEFLSVADDSAQSLPVIGYNGAISLNSRVSGNLLYFISKRPILSDSIIRFITLDHLDSAVDTVFTYAGLSGNYKFENRIPGNTTIIEPVNSLPYPQTIAIAVDAVDAAKAFAGRTGGSITLNEFQKIAADINNDGIISSSDALAILKISLGEITPAVFGLNNWVFIDSSYKISQANWASAPQNICYRPLDSVKTKQTFWGVMRGDVDADGVQPIQFQKVITANSVNGSSIVYSIPLEISALPGDTIAIPLNVKLNGKSIGALNASIAVDNQLLTYTGNYNEGTAIPAGLGWVVSAHMDGKNKLNIGATDFSGTLDPIINDGSVAEFRFVVNESAKKGDSCKIAITYSSAADSKLTDIPVSSADGKVTVLAVTSVLNKNITYTYQLEQNYPNPFNPATLITYSIAKEGRVNIEVFNSIGQRVTTLINSVQQPGNYDIKWNAESLPSGVYFYRIQAGSFSQTRKMILLK